MSLRIFTFPRITNTFHPTYLHKRTFHSTKIISTDQPKGFDFSTLDSLIEAISPKEKADTIAFKPFDERFDKKVEEKVDVKFVEEEEIEPYFDDTHMMSQGDGKEEEFDEIEFFDFLSGTKSLSEKEEQYDKIFKEAYEHFKREKFEETEEELGESPQFVDSFTLLQRHLGRLKFFNIYPRRVKRWIIDTKTPTGVYDIDGMWRAMWSQKSSAQESENQEDKQRLEKFAQEEEKFKSLPPDLKGKYRFGITQEEIENYPEKIKRLCSFHYASEKEIKQFRIHQHIEKYGKVSGDSGDSAVQVAVLTEKILVLNEHMRKNIHDFVTQRGLVKMLRRRKALLQYLKKHNPSKYMQVVTDLNIPDTPYL